ncbi:TPA: hypothetical protein EYP66_24805 [Candidatus Poribacteria bacterium]|nr:hypothetical protein [Candidatus Poribacteria bacterium]
MTKKIGIAISVTFIGILMVVAAIVWYDSATAQPPFPSPEASAICATNDYVYVLSGDTLYQFKAADLKLMGKTRIEKEPRFRPGKPGMMEEERFPPSRKTPEVEERK